ncbi:MAG: glycerophosphodiester phosphodiesterase family protein [Bacteroidota bacterium]
MDTKELDIQGHRGCRGLLPENTIPSFIHAVELGVNTLELDIAITADNHVVISHEPWMSSTICSHPDGTPVFEEEVDSTNIFKMTLEEVQAYDCGLRGHPDYPGQKSIAATKPSLKEAVKAVEGYLAENNLPPVFYNIETKSRPSWDSIFTPGPEEMTRLLYSTVSELGIIDKVIIQSFDPRTLEVLRIIDENIKTAFLVSNNESLESNLALLSFLPDIYSPNYVLTGGDEIALAQEKGMQVIPWTINKMEDMQQYIELGVDGIITDYPDVLIKLLKRE